MVQTLRLYGIPNCDTVKKARAWLAESKVPYEFHDFHKKGVPEAELDRWMARLGWERLLNKQSSTWRQLDDSTRDKTTTSAAARALMLAQPTLIKRPVVDADGELSLGFDTSLFELRFNT
ncbi:MAG: spxA [Rhizobacter sp.]|nr:spxA [Rhizobacter sp.]